eukprot:851556-Rhodomonas_salina.1
MCDEECPNPLQRQNRESSQSIKSNNITDSNLAVPPMHLFQPFQCLLHGISEELLIFALEICRREQKSSVASNEIHKRSKPEAVQDDIQLT